MAAEPRPRYFTNASRARRVGPSDDPRVASIFASPDGLEPIGIAYSSGHRGGFVEVFDGPTGDWTKDSFEDGPPETVWRLVIDDRCERPPGPYPGIVKGEVDGRFAMRVGEFVELGDADE